MAAARLLTLSKFTSNPPSSPLTGSRQKSAPVMCLSNAGLSSDITPHPSSGLSDQRTMVGAVVGCASSCVLTAESKTEQAVDLVLLAQHAAEAMRRWLIKNFSTKRSRPCWRFRVQAFVEKAIIDCRFFSLLAIAGSLIGSVLCFLEGCVLVFESYFQYFQAISRMSEQGQVILLLIEAIDMFLVGTAMLIFGMALHVMFVGTNTIDKGSNLSITSNLEELLSWTRMQSVMEAKSKIGHAVILILQVEVLEKFKSVAVTSGFDLACYAGVVFLCSASIFLLWRTAVNRVER